MELSMDKTCEPHVEPEGIKFWYHCADFHCFWRFSDITAHQKVHPDCKDFFPCTGDDCEICQQDRLNLRTKEAKSKSP